MHANLTRLICKHVYLPEDVVHYFVRRRVYFRIRILNREVQKCKKMKFKLKKACQVRGISIVNKE